MRIEKKDLPKNIYILRCFDRKMLSSKIIAVNPNIDIVIGEMCLYKIKNSNFFIKDGYKFTIELQSLDNLIGDDFL